MAAHHIEDALERLRSEFLAIPSLSLTPGEVARILNVDPPTAWGVLQALETSHFVERTRDGRFALLVARILNVDPPTAWGVLQALETSHFVERTRDGRFALLVPRSELRGCALCDRLRVHGSLLRVADTDEAEALWVCRDCQHKLMCRIDDEGVLGG